MHLVSWAKKLESFSNKGLIEFVAFLFWIADFKRGELTKNQ